MTTQPPTPPAGTGGTTPPADEWADLKGLGDETWGRIKGYAEHRARGAGVRIKELETRIASEPAAAGEAEQHLAAHTALVERVEAFSAALRDGLPDDRRSLVPTGLAPGDQLAWFAENLGKLSGGPGVSGASRWPVRTSPTMPDSPEARNEAARKAAERHVFGY